MFTWYELRTTELGVAQRFYAEVMQWDPSDPPGLFLKDGRAVAEISPLSEQARLRGAPVHWLGHIGVRDLDRALAPLLAAGAEPRGPTRVRGEGQVVVLCDPHGAMVALSTDSSRKSAAVSWHDLHVVDAEQALALYAQIFGLQPREVLELPQGMGAYHTFAHQPHMRPCGAVASIAHRPQVHTHWLHSFAVDDLDAACARVAAHGGEVFFGPATVFFDARIAVCHDPQGAEFALRTGPT